MRTNRMDLTLKWMHLLSGGLLLGACSVFVPHSSWVLSRWTRLRWDGYAKGIEPVESGWTFFVF